MADDSVFINYESGAATDEPLLVKDAVSFDHLSLHVAEQGEGHPYVFSKPPIGGEAVNTDADDLRVALFEIGEISLIRLQLLRSTPCEGQHVEGERDVLLPTEITEFDRLPLRVCESEIRSHLTDLELRLWSALLLRGRAAVTCIRT